MKKLFSLFLIIILFNWHRIIIKIPFSIIRFMVLIRIMALCHLSCRLSSSSYSLFLCSFYSLFFTRCTIISWWSRVSFRGFCPWVILRIWWSWKILWIWRSLFFLWSTRSDFPFLRNIVFVRVSCLDSWILFWICWGFWLYYMLC
jgi:hypothetical protein